MSNPLKKFSPQADLYLLEELKSIAKKEGKQFQSLVDEAFRELIEKRKNEKPRNHVMKAFLQSTEEYDSLYEKLAK